MSNDTDQWAAAGTASLQQDTAQQIRNNMINVSGQNPDQAAQYQHLAKFVNMPVEAVQADPDTVKAQAMAQRVDADNLAANSPHTANYVANPFNAAKSHDDIAPLTGVEAAVKALPAPTKAPPSFAQRAMDLLSGSADNIADVPFETMVDGLADVPKEIGKGLAGSINKAAGSVNLVLGAFPTLYDKAASLITGKQTTAAADSWFTRMVDPRMNAQAGLEASPDAPFVAKAANTAGNLLGTLGMIAATGGGGAAAGGATTTAGVVGQAAAHGVKAMAFPAISDSVQTANRVYQDTGDAGAAARAATAQYLTTSAGGIVPLSAPGGLLTRAAGGFASGAATGEAGRSVMNMVLPQSMQQPFDMENLVLSGLAGAGLGAAMGPRGEPSYNDAIRATYQDAAKAGRAEQGMQAMQALGEMATASKTRERDPEAFRQLVQDMSENGNLQDVYVSADKLGEVLHQSGVTPEQLAQKLPDIAAQVREAGMTNGDIRIPVEDYATHIAGGPVDAALLPHLKTDPDGMTYQEGQDYFTGQKEGMQAQAEEIGARHEADQAKQADSQGVYDDVLRQLNTLKRFNPETNKSYAALMKAYFETQGERSGMTAREVYDLSGLNIKGESLAPGLHQGAAPAEITDKQGAAYKLSMRTETFGFNQTLPNSLMVEAHDGAGKRVGMVDFALDGGKNVSAENAMVAESHQRRGIASAIYQAVRDAGYDIAPGRAHTEAGAKMVEAFQQRGIIGGDVLRQDNRGAYNPDTGTLALLKAADLSTFLHEAGHFFLESSLNLAAREGAPQSMRDDAAILFKHFGIEGDTALADWQGKSIDQKRDAHELFAQGFEKYLMEGKAPTIELQSLFSRFRSWLLNVYKSLSGLDVKLSPEVRGVMDRMLASDEAIRQAEQTRKYKLLFDTPESAGASLELFGKYESLGERATQEAIADMTGRSMRDLQWSSNAKAKAIKDLQKQAKGARDAIREQVAKEVAALPAERARAYLKTGEQFDTDGNLLPDTRALGAPDVKMDKAALAEMYPKDALGNPDLAKLRGLTAEGGLHPDIVAEMFGLQDGHELVRQLTEAPSAKDLVNQITDQRMLEQHGELTDADHIERAAEEAVHNETRARFMATGLKILSKSPIPARQLVKAAREAAEASVSAKRVRDLRPLQYLAAEARSNADAIKLAAKDPAGAVQAQRAALLNNQLFRAADGAVTAVQKALKYLAKFDRPAVREKIDLEYRDQIDALLDRYDLRTNVSGKALDKREALVSFVERQAAAGYEPQVPEHLLDEARRQHYKDMTVEEFNGLVDAVKSIDHLGRLKSKLIDGKEARDIADLAAEAVETMGKLKQRGAESNRGLTKIDAAYLGVKASGRSLQASLLKMEQMMDWLDGRKSTGVLNRVVFRRIADAGVKENDMQKRVKSGIDDLLHAHLNDVTKDGNKIYTADRLIDGLTGKAQRFTKKEMLSMAGHLGNESSWDKLTRGEGWAPDDARAFLMANMKKADWDFVAGMGKTLESLWPEKLAMSRRLGNSNPEKIAPAPFDTPHGRYDGWYWPMVYDPARAQDVAERGARSGDAMFENIYTRANTDTGRMNTRNENYAKPVLLSLDVVPRVIKDEIHDIAYREAIMDADKFLSTPKVRDGIVSALSQEHYDQLRPWLQSIANDRKVDMQALKWFDKLAHGARTRATIVGLGYRLSTMIVHGTSAAAESVAEVGPIWFSKGLADFSNPLHWRENKAFVFARSGEMRNRANEVDRDIREHLREIDLRMMDTTTGTAARGLDYMKARAYQGIAMFDMASALPTWMGAYHKGMADEAQGGRGLSEQDAIYFADKTVRNAHGGTGVKDQAAIQRGPEFLKLFTMFYTFWNHNVNRLMDTARLAGELPQTFRDGAPGQFRGDAGTVIMRTLIYTFGIQALHHMLHPKKDEEGDTNWAAWAAEELAASAFAGIPVLRDLSAHFLTGRDYSATPAAAMVDAASHSGKDALNLMAGQDANPKWLKHTVTTAGYVFGLPTGQAASSTQFLWDVSNGYQTPESMGDWWHGVTTGDMRQK